jgi:hypothetical protein
VLVAAVGLAGTPAAQASEPPVLDSGSLRLRVTSDTLAGVGNRKRLVDAADRRRRMLLAWPRGSSRAWFGEHGSLRSREVRHGWRLRIADRRRRRYRLQASMRVLRRPFVPCAVRVGRRTLPRKRWSYNRRRGVLRATLRARTARVLERRC